MDALKGCEKAMILIGPEGDFSPAEVARALDSGFRIMTLADTILRVETAALMAVAAFHFASVPKSANDFDFVACAEFDY